MMREILQDEMLTTKILIRTCSSLLVILLLLLTACDSTPNPSGPTTPANPTNPANPTTPSNPSNPNQSGESITVTGIPSEYKGKAAKVEFYYTHLAIDRKNLAATGALSETGEFSYTLTKPLDSVLVSGATIYKDATFSNPGVKLATSGLSSIIYSLPEDTPLGAMVSMSDRDDLILFVRTQFTTVPLVRPPGTYYASFYIYADRPVTITGTIQAEDTITVPDPPAPFPLELNLTLRQGWNVIYKRAVASNTPKGIISSSLETTTPSGFPKIDWFYVSMRELAGLP
jgi:hypothetical protein